MNNDLRDEKASREFFPCEFFSILTLPIRGMERRLTKRSHISHSRQRNAKINNKIFFGVRQKPEGRGKFSDGKMSKQGGGRRVGLRRISFFSPVKRLHGIII
jgi:hypothetical protein